MIEAPRSATLTVSASTTSAQSAALSAIDYVITADVPFHIVFGENPTATTGNLRVPADTMVRFVNVNPGEKFAVILPSGTGTVFYCPAI